MSELASRSQLRMSFLRWALVTVPVILLLGSAIGQLSNSGYDNGWFRALAKPDWFPPSWAFPAAWTPLYIMLGLSLAMILNARGARGRGFAIALFIVQLLVNYAWTPLFFGAHQVTAALALIFLNLALAIVTTFVFARIRKPAAWLLVPYMAWLSFATLLTYEMDRLNPNAESQSGGTRIEL